MVVRTVDARRYSQAVFQIAVERDELDNWQSDLNKIAGLADDAAFTALIEHPKLPLSDKTRLLSERLGAINPLALNLAFLLADRDSLSIAGEISEEYQRLLDGHRGIEQADVITAVPLADEDRTKLEERLGAMVNKTVIVKSEVDSSLLGGIVARIGGKLLDGSTLSRLEALKREIAGTAD
ncbi:MAG: hypothetical protein CL876_05745 [Dehalococcoidales bacterium]|jgi:F-type H+-transporting ATPase subunit delta|nr:hypothetical protein [Dehalococcoidales bacterium]